VKVPHQDGKAGAASLVIDPAKFDLSKFYTYITKQLPLYAAPLFLRIKNEIETTTTFKYKKVDLMNEGFNPDVIKEPLFFRDDKQGKYVPVTPQLYLEFQKPGSLTSNKTSKL